MGECNGCACGKLSSSQRKTYHSLGFKDKNNDGDIKKGVDGGYKRVADINRDGKLVRAEVLYYLHYVVKKGYKRAKQGNPLTQEHKKCLETLFQQRVDAVEKIKNRLTRSSTLVATVSKKAKAGLFKKALEVTKASITNALPDEVFTWKNDTVTWDKLTALTIIALEMSKAGKKKEKILGVFKLALAGARNNYSAFYEIASDMHKAGIDKKEVLAVFRSAIKAVIRLEKYDRPGAYKSIAAEMRKASIDEKTINGLFKQEGVKL